MRASEFAYKQDHPHEKRSAEAKRIREKYPDRIPVICEKDPRSDIPPVDKRKYLIPMDLTVGQFVYVIRKRISIPSDKAIFIFVNNTLPPTAALMSTVRPPPGRAGEWTRRTPKRDAAPGVTPCHHHQPTNPL